MLTVLPFLVCYCGLTLALCRQDLLRGLLPDSLTCPLLWSGFVFYLCLAPQRLEDAVWGQLQAISFLPCSTGYIGCFAAMRD